MLHRVKEERNNLSHLPQDCLLKHTIEGKIEGTLEVMGGRERRCKQLLDDQEKDRILERVTGSTRLHSIENSLRKRLWTCLKTECGMNEQFQTVSDMAVTSTLK